MKLLIEKNGQKKDPVRSFMNNPQALKKINNEKGMVLVVVIMLLTALVIIGFAAINMTNTDMKISANYRSGSQAFYIAEAGLENARDQLRINIAGGSTMSQLLAARAGTNGVLSNSNEVANFYSGGGFVSDDVPYIANTTFGAGTYRVYLTNAAPESVTSTTDADDRVTLTSIGRVTSDNSMAVAQIIVQPFKLPNFPGAIVLPGPNADFKGVNSNASGVAGGMESAISTNSAAAEAAVETHLTDIGRIDNYVCNTMNGAACINNEPAEFSTSYSTVSGINGLYNTIKTMADNVFPSPSSTSCPSVPCTLAAVDVGTTSNRKIVVVDGDATLGPINGAGILVVTGKLTLKGNFNYDGVILVIGKGDIYRDGGGTGTINGGILVANTNDATSDTVLGTPTFDTSGGGNSNINYSAGSINPPGGRPFVKLSWRRM